MCFLLVARIGDVDEPWFWVPHLGLASPGPPLGSPLSVEAMDHVWGPLDTSLGRSTPYGVTRRPSLPKFYLARLAIFRKA